MATSLAELAAKLKKVPTSASVLEKSEAECAAFLGTPLDESYAPYLKGMFGSFRTYITYENIELLSHLTLYCTKRNVTRVVSTNTKLLSKLLEQQGTYKGNPKLSDYQGSWFFYNGIQIVFISPLSQLFSVSYGKFIAARFISKVISPQDWYKPTPFKWTVIDASNVEETYEEFRAAFYIACDIETFKVNLAIRCVGYTALFVRDSRICSHSCVIPLDSPFFLTWVRKFNALPIPKIFQNGKYDNSYLLRYNAEPLQWYGDTANAMHCWYSELPKDLAFLNAFFLREVVYWKDLAETNDLYEYYKYNAMDTWATANVWCVWILTAPDWAKRNYTLEFPLNYPCLLAEMAGLKRDEKRLLETRAELDKQEAALLGSLQKSVGAPSFNPASHVQVKQLLKIVGCADLADSSDEKHLKKAILRHPLIDRLLGESGVLGIRGLRKLKSTYLRTSADAEKDGEGGAKEFCGRILYALNPHSTDTGRLASKEHHFWTGVQIQNIPRGPEVKRTLCADDGFLIGECDLKQAESWDTAYITGDNNLIAAVNSERDFHSTNASAFFGVPYENIFNDSTRKTLDKKLRDLAKRVIHGASYNMGALVLIDTMGIDKVWEAARILKLPRGWNLEDIAEYLLTVFHIRYSQIRGPIALRSSNVRQYLNLPGCTNKHYSPGTYYSSVANAVATSKLLVSRAFHATRFNLDHFEAGEYIKHGDWTRYCFGNPEKNKLDLNSYVAHGPQSLNARTLNEAWLRVFYEVALREPTDFRLHAQIHDSILFSYREGRADLADRVKECMEIPVTIRDISGVVRTFTVPADLKLGKPGKPSVYWSDTE